MNIKLCKGIETENINSVMQWTNERGADFLKQWAGPKLRFPLTEEQIIAESETIFSIMDENVFIGIVQILVKTDDNAHIGRFVINPSEVGRGIGTEAMNSFCKILFVDNIKSVTLCVYPFNKSAIRCYEKCGYQFDENIYEGNKLVCIKMRLMRKV